MKTIIHDLVQGSPEWVEFRRTRHGASEAAAMLGMSKNMTRSQLLHYKFTGIAPEFSEWVQENILDEGHRVEAAIRSHIESLIGDDLSPVTCSLESTVLSASCDGLTLDSRVAWEHKQWNAELAASVERGIVPDTHMPQCQQVLMVTGADELIFTVSDGTPERCVSATVFPIAGWVHRIRAGWSQFNSDFSMYVPPEKTEPITASHQDSLPAISVQASGALLVVDNLQPFGVALRAFVAKIPKTPSTDQEFADTDAACKRLGEVETRLKSTEDSALASMADVEKLRRTIADLLSVARTARLASEKLVKSRNDEIREAEVKRGRDAIAAYVAAANDGLGGNYIIPCGRFADAIKGLKTLDSVRNAIDTEIASAKIETSTQATRIAENLKTINATGRDHLFADRVTLATHLPESVTAIVAQRVSEDDARIAREAKAAEERAALAIETKKAREAALEAARQQSSNDGRGAAAVTPVALPASPSMAGFAYSASPVVRAPASKPTMTISALNSRLGFVVTSDFLAGLGFVHTQDKASKLYQESDLPAICRAIAIHLSELSQEVANA